MVTSSVQISVKVYHAYLFSIHRSQFMQGNLVLILYFDRITVICAKVVMINAEDTPPEQTARGALHKVSKVK